jgi:MoaA/NifB/PqqE/SkfB family radical SAM enzyme
MRCNYSCAGCYAADRDSQDELSTVELDALFDEAARLGVLAILVTGGEPLLRRDIPGLVERHRGLFFVLITNGSLLEPSIARRLARSGNALTLVSIEGSELNTDSRRGAGAHAKAMRALEMLEGADAFHGFAATACMDNVDYIASDVFRSRARTGCSTRGRGRPSASACSI